MVFTGGHIPNSIWVTCLLLHFGVDGVLLGRMDIVVNTTHEVWTDIVSDRNHRHIHLPTAIHAHLARHVNVLHGCHHYQLADAMDIYQDGHNFNQPNPKTKMNEKNPAALASTSGSAASKLNKCESCGVNFVTTPETYADTCKDRIKICVWCENKILKKTNSVQADTITSLAQRLNAVEDAIDKTLECSNGHYNPILKCGCYDRAHKLIMGEQQKPEARTNQPLKPE
jgi:hypothetical protein